MHFERWEKTLDVLRERIEPYEFREWIMPIFCKDIDDESGEIVLSVPDDFHGRWLEENFVSEIRATLRTVTDADFSVRFSIPEHQHQRADELQPTPDHSAPPIVQKVKPPPLIERYRFEAFVDGPTNQFAMTAARAVADHPGVRYNPLFIFGGVGLGKTHLLHSVGHAVAEKNPGSRILYVTSEEYVNDLIQAIRTDTMQSFRRKYRDDCDVLLIDDIQFIAGKDRSQEEFFHMFNTLHSSHKQIVLTCDQLPHTIPDMEDRLRSRLQWGLITDIKPPGFETRVAILNRKAEADGIDLPQDAAMLIARHVSRNVRELEGALMRLGAHATLLQRPIDLELAQQALGDLIGDTLRRVQPDQIIRAVCQEFKVSLADLKGPRRHRTVTVPRQVAMYLIRELTEESLPQIGGLFGGRDHSTVINALKRVKGMLDASPDITQRIRRLRRELQG